MFLSLSTNDPLISFYLFFPNVKNKVPLYLLLPTVRLRSLSFLPTVSFVLFFFFSSPPFVLTFLSLFFSSSSSKSLPPQFFFLFSTTQNTRPSFVFSTVSFPSFPLFRLLSSKRTPSVFPSFPPVSGSLFSPPKILLVFFCFSSSVWSGFFPSQTVPCFFLSILFLSVSSSSTQKKKNPFCIYRRTKRGAPYPCHGAGSGGYPATVLAQGRGEAWLSTRQGSPGFSSWWQGMCGYGSCQVPGQVGWREREQCCRGTKFFFPCLCGCRGRRSTVPFKTALFRALPFFF